MTQPTGTKWYASVPMKFDPAKRVYTLEVTAAAMPSLAEIIRVGATQLGRCDDVWFHVVGDDGTSKTYEDGYINDVLHEYDDAEWSDE